MPNPNFSPLPRVLEDINTKETEFPSFMGGFS